MWLEVVTILDIEFLHVDQFKLLSGILKVFRIEESGEPTNERMQIVKSM